MQHKGAKKCWLEALTLPQGSINPINKALSVMKSMIITLWFFALLCRFTEAAGITNSQASRQTWYFAESGVVCGFRVVLGSEKGGPPARVDSPIVYAILTDSEEASVVYFPRNVEYFCDAKLYTTNRVPLAKTQVGRKWGSSFDKVSRIYVDRKNRIVEAMALNGGWWIGKTTSINEPLFRPDELFEIKEPGLYHLRLRFQVFQRAKNGSTSSLSLIRFPDLECDVIKPRD